MSVVVQENQGRGRPTIFTKEVVSRLVKLERDGLNYEEIAKELKIKPNTIRGFIGRHRDELNIARKGHRGFEADWYGAVPFGHWTICKRWGSKAFTLAVGEAVRRGCHVSIK